MKDKFLRILHSPGYVSIEVSDRRGYLGKWVHWFEGWMCVIHRFEKG